MQSRHLLRVCHAESSSLHFQQLQAPLQLLALRESLRRVSRGSVLHLQQLCADSAFCIKQAVAKPLLEVPGGLDLVKDKRDFSIKHPARRVVPVEARKIVSQLLCPRFQDSAYRPSDNMIIAGLLFCFAFGSHGLALTPSVCKGSLV